MTVRLLGAAIAALAFVLPAAAQAPAKGHAPALTFQVAPGGKLLDDAKAIAQHIGGEMVLKEFEASIKTKLGDDGFLGVDMLKPIVGYTELSETAEASGFIVAVPITTEEQFLALLKRTKIEAEPVKGDKGFYKLTAMDDQKKGPTALRFVGKLAYLGTNVPDESLAKDKLVPAADLIDLKETAAFAYRLHIARIPAGLRKQGFEAFDQFAEQLKGMPGGAWFEGFAKAAGEAAAKLVKRFGDQVFHDGDVVAVRIRLDAAKAEAGLEVALSGKKGSKLAADVAARKPSTNRFAGIVGPDAVGSAKVQLPLFAPELQAMAAAGLELAQKSAGEGATGFAKASVEELLKGLIRAVKAGDFDMAASLAGPDAAGTYTGIAAFSFDNPIALEKALRKLVNDSPDEIQKLVTLDAAKVNGTSIHEADVSGLIPPEAKAVFGEKAVLGVALAPKGIYLAFGPDARKLLTAALKAEPAPARVLDLAINPARLAKVIAAVQGDDAAKKIAEVIGTTDALLSVLLLSVEGGDELRVRIGFHLKVLAGGVFATRAVPLP